MRSDEIRELAADIRAAAAEARKADSEAPPAVRAVLPFWRGIPERHRAAVVVALIVAAVVLALNGAWPF